MSNIGEVDSRSILMMPRPQANKADNVCLPRSTLIKQNLLPPVANAVGDDMQRQAGCVRLAAPQQPTVQRLQDEQRIEIRLDRAADSADQQSNQHARLQAFASHVADDYQHAAAASSPSPGLWSRRWPYRNQLSNEGRWPQSSRTAAASRSIAMTVGDWAWPPKPRCEQCKQRGPRGCKLAAKDL
jgi:hypothetical protein